MLYTYMAVSILFLPPKGDIRPPGQLLGHTGLEKQPPKISTKPRVTQHQKKGYTTPGGGVTWH